MEKNTKDNDIKDLRNFGLIMGVMLVLVFGLLLPWIWNAETLPMWPWVAAGVFALWGLLIPATLAPVFSIWMKIGHVLGWVNTRIIMGFIFYIIIFPIGFVIRLFGGDLINKRLDSNASTYRKISKVPSPESMERPF